MILTPLTALSPLDGRYAASAERLRRFFSEEALIRARVEVEVRYFIALSREPGVKELPPVNRRQEQLLGKLLEGFDAKEAQAVKDIEKTTRHDVKAVEYYLKDRMGRIGGLGKRLEFVHFGLTSEDVNNLAYGTLIQGALAAVILPALRDLVADVRVLATAHANTPLLSLTHGQPATPTTLGKEFLVFQKRLERQLTQLKAFRMQGKLGGAVGNFSAHSVAYPDVKWEKFRTTFVKGLKLDPLEASTQINPHDDLAELSHLLMRINTILLDLSRDMWLYVSRGVFRQKVVAGEVGSSAMPHKVNPIDFENAEGNIGISSALFAHFAEKLPVSRLQRDLSDSTVQRNIGVAFGYHLLAVSSMARGFSRAAVDKDVIRTELARHPEVVAEAVQTILRKHGIMKAYEHLKALTRGKTVSAKDIAAYVDTLRIPADEKTRLKALLPK